jgi:hypothetical protein
LSLEGLGSAFPLFLVVWIMTFSLMHPQEVVAAAAVPEDLTEAVSNVVESVILVAEKENREQRTERHRVDSRQGEGTLRTTNKSRCDVDDIDI